MKHDKLIEVSASEFKEGLSVYCYIENRYKLIKAVLAHDDCDRWYLCQDEHSGQNINSRGGSKHGFKYSWVIDPCVLGIFVKPVVINKKGQFYCYHCKKYHDTKTIKKHLVNSLSYCSDCFKKYFKRCNHCKTICNVKSFVKIGRKHFCASCLKSYKRDYPVKEYDGTEPFIFLKKDNETTKEYFGFELEYDFKNKKSYLGSYILEKYGDYCEVKLDCTVECGFELAFMPMTYNYLKSFKKFNSLLGFINRQDDLHIHRNCGMHIHINREAFGSRRHIHNFCLFIHHNQTLVEKISRREQGYNRYYPDTDMYDMEEEYNDVLDRPSVTNLKYNTLEIRSFLTATNVKDILVAVEFLKVMMEISRRYDYDEDFYYQKFIEVAINKKKTYKALYSFMKKEGILD